VNHAVIEADSRSGDVADQSTWRALPTADIVVHLAGRSFVPDSWTQPTEFIRTNALGTIGALDYARERQARVVFLSSYLYGHPQTVPIPETAPLVATNPYALSKKLAEDACRFYAESFGVSVTVLRPFNVYGPGQSEEFLIPSIIRQIMAGGPIRVRDLEPKRDYVYVTDVVRSIVKAVDHANTFRVLNIGSGTSHSVRELIDMIQTVWGTQLPVLCEGKRRKDEVMDTVADISEAQRHLHWSPEWTLSRGVANLRVNPPAAAAPSTALVQPL
jgi:nucleoside-diphosphate-sugar epimerase